MNKQELEKESDEIFPELIQPVAYDVKRLENGGKFKVEKIKGALSRKIDVMFFIDSKIQYILQELVGEERKDCMKESGICEHFHGDDKSYNEKRQEIIDKIQEMGYGKDN